MYGTRVFSFCAVVIFVMWVTSTVIHLSFSEPDESVIAQGKHYQTECKLVETNINNGLFSADTNRVDCNGVINNVATSDYNSAIDAYENSISSGNVTSTKVHVN